jgi:putative endonuclease
MVGLRQGTGEAQNTKARGDAAEALALAYLQGQGLTLLARNYRVALGPSRRAGEVDLIMRECDGTLVFIEVRARADTRRGGAAASVTPTKQRHVLRAAQHYLQRLNVLPPCRFDVVALDGGQLEWLRGAFDASFG